MVAKDHGPSIATRGGAQCTERGAPAELRFTIPARPEAVAAARHQVTLLDDLPGRVVADAELVVSELVANSVLHAGLGVADVIDVAFRRGESCMIIEVDDHDGLFGKTAEHPRGRRAGGMGLKLLDAICEHWQAEAGRVVASVRM